MRQVLLRRGTRGARCQHQPDQRRRRQRRRPRQPRAGLVALRHTQFDGGARRRTPAAVAEKVVLRVKINFHKLETGQPATELLVARVGNC